MDKSVMFVKWACLVISLAAICVAGCSGGDASAPVAKAATPSGTAKAGQSGSAPLAGLNPSYHGSAAADDAKVGSAMKSK